MKRAELVKQLELVQPAVADTNLVLVNTCFVFKDKSISANNEKIAIVSKGGVGTTPFAVSGVALLGLLQNSHAEEVDFKVTDESVVIKTGKSVFKLPYFKETEFMFEEPKEKWVNVVNLSDGLLNEIGICLTTVSSDESKPAFLGVCFNFEGKKLVLFSTDGDAITRCATTAVTEGGGIYTVPTGFCEALLKIALSTETSQGKLMINENWAKAVLNNGYTIYGRMILNNKPVDHQQVMDESLKKGTQFVALPLGLDDALARARVLADPESLPTSMTVKGGKLQLWTTTHMGDIKDELNIKGHPDAEAIVHASLIHRSLKISDQMAILEGVTAYKHGGVLQIVANIGA